MSISKLHFHYRHKGDDSQKWVFGTDGCIYSKVRTINHSFIPNYFSFFLYSYKMHSVIESKKCFFLNKWFHSVSRNLKFNSVWLDTFLGSFAWLKTSFPKPNIIFFNSWLWYNLEFGGINFLLFLKYMYYFLKLSYNWCITLCKFKVYNAFICSIIYWNMIIP